MLLERAHVRYVSCELMVSLSVLAVAWRSVHAFRREWRENIAPNWSSAQHVRVRRISVKGVKKVVYSSTLQYIVTL